MSEKTLSDHVGDATRELWYLFTTIDEVASRLAYVIPGSPAVPMLREARTKLRNIIIELKEARENESDRLFQLAEESSRNVLEAAMAGIQQGSKT